MDEYFNEDDLINDYIAHADEEEPPFEEEYMEPPDDDNEPNNNAVVEPNKNTNVDLNDNDDAAAAPDGNINAASKNTTANADIVSAVVPQLISTSPPANESTSSSSWRNKNGNDSDDLYGFERYAGLSSWRTTTTNNNGGNNKEGGEKHGATTMEATGWKKKNDTKGGGLSDGDDDSLMSDNDEMDNGRVRKKRNDGKNTGTAGTRGGEAQLVRFRELDGQIVLGRSWGRGGHGDRMGDGRCVHANKQLPELGEASVAMTLADGTRTFVKRSDGSKHAGLVGSSKNGTENKKNDTSGDNQEECLLGLPMTELVRRADIIQRRAIQRNVEREARYGKPSNKDDDNDAANEGEKDSNNEADGQEKDSNAHDLDNETVENMEEKDEAKEMSIRQHLKRKHRQHKMMQLQQRLWVDKHAPTSISHLLSDERTNREVLRALRAWDPYVFKKEAPVRPVSAHPSKFGNGQQQDGQGKFGGKKDYHKRDKNKEGGNDNNAGKADNARVDVRPDENSRVILLSGPPGVGKTTLAHIVCKHAGYRPIEVNASDERSASALTERVTRAMESSTLDLASLTGENNNEGGGKKKGGKPNCIILDEVDGADAKASIAALVDIIRAGMPPAGASSKGKKGKGTTYLRRPIILICNHKYVPALRPILPYARQFDVQPPNPERLTGRLRAVLAAEHMSVVAGGMLLHRLVAVTGGDVRSCLYALQFASARARELAVKKREREGLPTGDKNTAIMVDISSTLVASMGDNGNGLKDIQSDVTNTVATVFRKSKVRNQNKRLKMGKGSSRPVVPPKGVDIVLKAVDHFGDNSKTLDCLFMNVNRVSYVDPTLDRCCSAFEWLSGADMYRSQRSNVAMNNSAEHHSMQKFHIPSAVAAIHLLCCVETRPDLTFSTRPLADAHYQNQANVSLVHRFVEGLTPRARRGIGGGTDTVVSDVIPYGLWLLSAGDGKHSLSTPVSSVDMLSAEEKLAFSAHVATLRALGLTYVKNEGTFDYQNPDASAENIRLEPEIDKLVKFEDMNQHSGRKDIPPMMKELLAHGATVAALRERESESQIAQQEAAAAGEKAKQKPKEHTDAPKVPEKKTTITPKKQPVKAAKNSSAAKNFLGFRAAKAKKAKSDKRASRVGFDRSKKVKLSNTGSGVGLSKVIRFKYQKGFTQAVRAPCQLEDLL